MRRSFTSIPWPLKLVARLGIKTSHYMLKFVAPSLEIVFPTIDRIAFSGYTQTLVEPRPHSIIECLQELDMKTFLEAQLQGSVCGVTTQGSVRS